MSDERESGSPRPAEPAPETTTPADEGPPRWSGFGPVFLYWLVFLGILGLAVLVNEKYPRLVEVHFARWTARLTGKLIEILGMGGSVHGVYIVSPYCNFIIIGECTAYYPLAIFVGAVAAYPCRWLRKLLGLALGLPAIILVNQVRLVSLCYIHRSYPDVFDAIHALVWQSLMIFFTIVVWILWVSTLAGSHED